MRLSMLGLLRAAYTIVAALVVTTLLPRLGVPSRFVPDLVLIGVVATAVIRGPVHGALVGLAAGWVVELMPPVAMPLGLAALTMMLAGIVAGSFRRSSARSVLRPLAALAVAATVVLAGEGATAVVAGGSVDLTASFTALGLTVGVALALLPFMVVVDRALVRRRLG
ncbi:MAG TPA: rod shape-determining protein MreD [Intrasporangium sp.]|uniref:rod shape-determining protein MreD n=1 Tax=Intrasporangium sp. TaxID=1925024 RepID=UPI002B45E4EC|nr:rod shape-determining protein MreD [Intrasporangium sp.]HKX68097.1 rod shape-determining protein MreD [Intrasporangium sp.]